MIASRNPSTPDVRARAAKTACPPRRSCVRRSATPARRRGQACGETLRTQTIAFGAVLPTPATSVAGVDNTVCFTLMPDT